ncbi:hypothetical protein CAL29_06445 [Bordetella genomosp. 10]|uniref:RNA polymerase sigma factor 70 region 4 type 2 domain-containing protein n=1 Tax=Bordetella genomosp. 10 TaxID=1416804 RepID=A0A261SNV9_9BORD|nr:hypothetical protein CAL29_06445 [Bordetella genomosp. 10]
MLETMRRDEKYAQSLHYLAETRITAQLRRKFFRVPPELVVDAFNEAFLQLLGSKTFHDDAFRHNQPSAGWTAAELVTHVFGGYLYVSARNELTRLAGLLRQGDGGTSDEEPFALEEIADETLAGDPVGSLEQSEFLKSVQACMEKLDGPDYDALQMYLDQVPIATIADQLNETSPGNMKTRLHRIRKRVIECVQRRLR